MWHAESATPLARGEKGMVKCNRDVHATRTAAWMSMNRNDEASCGMIRISSKRPGGPQACSRRAQPPERYNAMNHYPQRGNINSHVRERN